MGNQFDYVVAFGCSLVWGAELADRNKRYAQLIANKYRAKLLDYSVCGNSNENISQTAINVLLKQNLQPERTLVLFGWTYSPRLNYSSKNGNYYVIAEFNLLPSRRKTKLAMHNQTYFNDDFYDLMDLKNYYDYHTNTAYMLYNLSRNIHHAQLFLKSNGYKYVFSFASQYEKHLVTSPQQTYDLLGIVKPYTTSTYPEFIHQLNDIDKTYICPVPFTNYTESLGLKHGFELHPLEDGHAAYAKVLIDFVESKYGQQTLPRTESGIS
jgi:hypothetical protein